MQKKPNLDAFYTSFRIPRRSWKALPQGWERSEGPAWNLKIFEESPKEAKAALKKILGASDRGMPDEIGWGVEIADHPDLLCARAWLIFPRGVSPWRSRMEIHVNAAQSPDSKEELAARFPQVYQACLAEEAAGHKLSESGFLKMARQKLTDQARLAAETLLKLAAVAGGLPRERALLASESVARVESMLIAKAAMAAAQPQADESGAAPRRPRL